LVWFEVSTSADTSFYVYGYPNGGVPQKLSLWHREGTGYVRDTANATVFIAAMLGCK
jgi:hypothetical protein